MFLQRLVVTAILLPIGIAVIYFGGVAFTALVILVMSVAAWEYVKLFNASGLKPAGVLVMAGVLFLALGRVIYKFQYSDSLISALILASMAFHLIDYELGRDRAATDFGVTLVGIFYFGWIGAYFISLRNLPDGMWWVLLVLPSIWCADMGGYVIGRSFGRHKLSPRLSPKKTWEGYWAGVVWGTLGCGLLAWLFQAFVHSNTAITWQNGLILGFVLAILCPLGDLGESMIKRQAGMKDSSNLLPGHGGIFDRIDSWLWGAVIGYYFVVWFLT